MKPLMAAPVLPFEHWSYSKLNLYVRCPRRFRFEYIDQAPPEETSIALLLGSAVHGAVAFHHARHLHGESVDADQVVLQFEQLLLRAVEHSEVQVAYTKVHADLDSTRELGKRMLAAYLAQHEPAHILALEQELSCTLPGSDLPLVGIVDRIEQSDGSLRIVELKTSARAWSEAEAEINDQATSYSVLMGHPVGIRFEVLTKTKEPKLQVLDTRRTEQDHRHLIAQVHHVERGVRAGVFPRNPSTMNCSGCPYRRRCAITVG